MDISATHKGKGGRGKGNEGYKGKQQSKGQLLWPRAEEEDPASPS